MPIYDYRCISCHYSFEEHVKNIKENINCPKCGKKAEKEIPIPARRKNVAGRKTLADQRIKDKMRKHGRPESAIFTNAAGKRIG